jgi:hypothetical protein
LVARRSSPLAIALTSFGFHSISFPSEWGAFATLARMGLKAGGFHSISFPSEWGAGTIALPRV